MPSSSPGTPALCEAGAKGKGKGKAPQGKAPPGKAPPGKAPPGKASGKAPPGKAPPGKATLGKAPPGKAPPGKAPPGKAPPGKAPPGKAPPGKAPPAKAAHASSPSSPAPARSPGAPSTPLGVGPFGTKRIRWRPLPSVEGTVFEQLGTGPLPREAAQLLREVLEPPCQTSRTPQSARGQILSARLSRSSGTCLLDRERAQSLGIIFKRFLVPFDLFCSALDTLNFSLHVSEEDIDGWLQAWPTEEEQKRVLEFKGSKAELRDVERNVRQIARVPRSDARLKLLRLAKGLDDLRSIMGVRLWAIKVACSALLGSTRWRELLAVVLQHGNYINGGSESRGFTMDALQLLRSLKGTHGASVLHCLCIALAKEDPHFCGRLLEDLERVPQAAQYNLGTLQDLLRKLSKDLDFAEKELVEHSSAYMNSHAEGNAEPPSSPGLCRGPLAAQSSTQVFDIASARGDAPVVEAPAEATDLMPPRSSRSASSREGIVTTPRRRSNAEGRDHLTESPARAALRAAAERSSRGCRSPKRGLFQQSPTQEAGSKRLFQQSPTREAASEEWKTPPMALPQMPASIAAGQPPALQDATAAQSTIKPRCTLCVPQLRLAEEPLLGGRWPGEITSTSQPLETYREEDEDSGSSESDDEGEEDEVEEGKEDAAPAKGGACSSGAPVAARQASPETCSTSTGSAKSDDISSPRQHQAAQTLLPPLRIRGPEVTIVSPLTTPRSARRTGNTPRATPRETPRDKLAQPGASTRAGPSLLTPCEIQHTLYTPRDSQLAQGAGLLTPRAVTTPRGLQVTTPRTTPCGVQKTEPLVHAVSQVTTPGGVQKTTVQSSPPRSVQVVSPRSAQVVSLGAPATPRGAQAAPLCAQPELQASLAAHGPRPGTPRSRPPEGPAAGAPELPPTVGATPPGVEPCDGRCPPAIATSLGGQQLLPPAAHGGASPGSGPIAGPAVPGLPTPRGRQMQPSPRGCQASTPRGGGAARVPRLALQQALHELSKTDAAADAEVMHSLRNKQATADAEEDFSRGWSAALRPSCMTKESASGSPKRSALVGPLGSARKRTSFGSARDGTDNDSSSDEVTANGGGSSWSGRPGKVHFVFALNGSFPSPVEVCAPESTPQGWRRQNFGNQTAQVNMVSPTVWSSSQWDNCTQAPHIGPPDAGRHQSKALEQLQILVARGRVLVQESAEQLAEVSTAIDKCERYFGGGLPDSRQREGKETIRLFELVSDALKQFRMAWEEVHRDERWAQYMPHAPRSGRAETPLTAREFRKRRHPSRRLCWT